MKFFVFIILYLTSLSSIFAESTSPSKGIIATSNPHASKAAKDIIDKGGNAIDASVAVQLVLTLTEPCLLYTSPSPRDPKTSRMPSSA